MTRAKRIAFLVAVGVQAAVVLGMVAIKQSVILYGQTIILKIWPVDPHSLFYGDYARFSFDVNHPMIPKDGSWPPRKGDRVYAELAPSATSWNLVSVHSKVPETLSGDHVLLRGAIRSWHEWSGHPVFGLVDVSSPGWLNTQSSTSSWRISWGAFGQKRRGLWYNSYRELKEGTTVFVLLHPSYGKDWHVSTIATSTSAPSSYYYGHRERHVVLAGRLGSYENIRFLNIGYGIESYFIPEGKGRKYEQPELDVEIAVSRKGHAVVKRVILPSGQ